MYIELYGNTTQNHTDGFPATVYLKLRRRSGAFFRNGTGGIREFRQPLGLPRTLQFNRFVITNATECTLQKQMGISKSIYCLKTYQNLFFFRGVQHNFHYYHFHQKRINTMSYE